MEIKKVQTLDVQAVVDAVLQNEYAEILDDINGEII